MKFTNEIQLNLPADDVFATLTDVERVASCLPGARVVGRDGDAYTGAMRLRVGPIVADYGGTLTFIELDEKGRRAVLLAKGEETGGQGTAEARIVSSVKGGADRAEVVVETELQVRGRVAQFGSGPMEKIAKRMFAEFAKNLEAEMVGARDANTAPAIEATAPEDARTSDAGTAAEESLDVFGLVAAPVAQALRASAVPVLIALVIGYLLGRRRGS